MFCAAVSIRSVVWCMKWGTADRSYSLQLQECEKNEKDLQLWPVKLLYSVVLIYSFVMNRNELLLLWSNSRTCDISWFYGNFTFSFPESVITTDKVASADLIVFESTYFNFIRCLTVKFLSTWKKCYVQNTAGRQSFSHITSTTKPFVGFSLSSTRQFLRKSLNQASFFTKTVSMTVTLWP